MYKLDFLLTEFYSQGGLGGFGLEMAQWLTERGARHLVLSSRSGIRTGYQSRCIRLWKENGINVIVSKNDISTEEGAARLLNEAAALGPVGGIFNLAAVSHRSGQVQNAVYQFYFYPFLSFRS